MIFKLLDKIIGFINQSIAAIGISAGVALAFTNVVARYVFDSSLTWAAELTVYLFLWSTFFGAAYTFKLDGHISIDVLLEKLQPGITKTLMLISYTITFLFISAVAYYGYEYVVFVYEFEEMSIDLGIPMWYIYLVLPIAFSFAAYRILEHIVRIIKTPSDKVLRKSEADHLLDEMKIDKDKLVKDVEKRTGGML